MRATGIVSGVTIARTPDPERIASKHFGLHGTASPLPGYADTNVRLATESGDFVMRMSSRTDGASADAMMRAMVASHDAGLPSATVVRAIGGATFVELEDGVIATVRGWLAGTTYEELGYPAAAARSIGSTAARMVAALAQLEDAPKSSDRWNLLCAAETTEGLFHHLDSDLRRTAVRTILSRLAATNLEDLPRQAVHNDLNPGNLIVEGDQVVGIIDFGDCTRTLRIAELAIACAYVMLTQDDPVRTAAAACAAYAERQEVTASESAAFLNLVLARLATSVTVAASRPPDNPHHHSTTSAAWDIIHRLLTADLSVVDAELRTALGHPTAVPDPVAPLVQDRAVLGPSLRLSYAEPLVVMSGRGQYLFDHRGRRYLDCVNNVCHVGHAEPRVVRALANQASSLNTNTRYLHPEILRYAERLTQTLPADLDTVYLVNSGTEANELALRLATSATGHSDIAAVEYGYHGNTTMLVDISHYKFAGPGGSPQKEWVRVLPSLDSYDSPAEYARAASKVLRHVDLAGGIVEALPGCAGQVVPAPGVVATAYDAIRTAGGVVIADEVQTGFGRVGSAFWSFELHDVTPDIVTMGKPAGNGHPLGAVVTTKMIANALDNGMEYFNTFGGNPVSAAVGNAVLDVIEEDQLQAHAARVGAHLKSLFATVADGNSHIADVRGEGLFIGIEIVSDAGLPDPVLAAAVVEWAKAQGVLLSTDGPHDNVIKIKPPLPFTHDDAGVVADVIGSALAMPIANDS